MVGRKRLLRVVAVLSAAVAIGQTVEWLRLSAAPEKSGVAVSGHTASNGLIPSSASLYPAGPGQLPDLKGITPVAAVIEATESNVCKPSMVLSVSEGAMIDVTVRAPCNPAERVVIRHSGIAFTVKTGVDGHVSLSLPALEQDALVAAYFEGSEVALATVAVPEAAELARFAFQAPFPFEFKLLADTGDATKVSEAGARDRITTLGTKGVLQPLIAQFYTFPGIDLGSRRLSVEVQITDLTCSRSFLAETRISQGGGVTAHALPIEVPICGTSGDILLLNNLVPDLTLATPR